MTKEREYRAYAGTCVDLANKATNDKDKKHLLAMAEAWLGLVDRVQRRVPEPDAGSLHPALRAKFWSPPAQISQFDWPPLAIGCAFAGARLTASAPPAQHNRRRPRRTDGASSPLQTECARSSSW